MAEPGGAAGAVHTLRCLGRAWPVSRYVVARVALPLLGDSVATTTTWWLHESRSSRQKSPPRTKTKQVKCTTTNTPRMKCGEIDHRPLSSIDLHIFVASYAAPSAMCAALATGSYVCSSTPNGLTRYVDGPPLHTANTHRLKPISPGYTPPHSTEAATVLHAIISVYPYKFMLSFLSLFCVSLPTLLPFSLTSEICWW